MYRVIFSLAVFSAALLGAAEIKNNAAVAFLGDSITQYGHNKAAGYDNLTVAGLAQNGVKVRLIKAGVSGQVQPDAGPGETARHRQKGRFRLPELRGQRRVARRPGRAP